MPKKALTSSAPPPPPKVKPPPTPPPPKAPKPEDAPAALPGKGMDGAAPPPKGASGLGGAMATVGTSVAMMLPMVASSIPSILQAVNVGAVTDVAGQALDAIKENPMLLYVGGGLVVLVLFMR